MASNTARRHSLQAQLEATLRKSGIPADNIHCYGSQIVITTRGRETAERWFSLIGTFATPLRIIESIDYNKVNTNTVMHPSSHKVWRVYGRI
jgi:hypothetical protein